MGIDHNFEGALIKSLLASGMMPRQRHTAERRQDKAEALPIIRKLSSLNYRVYATEVRRQCCREQAYSNVITRS